MHWSGFATLALAVTVVTLFACFMGWAQSRD
jgi:hypothetical protein